MDAKRFREMFHAIHNLDRSELERAGVMLPDDSDWGSTDWERFNNDLTTFVLKLPADRLEKLFTLIESH